MYLGGRCFMKNDWLRKWSEKLKSRRLAMAVTSVLLAGAVQLPAMAANTYTSPLNLTTSDNAFLLEEGDTVTGSIEAPYNLVYNLQDGTSIAGVAGCIKPMFQNTTATINIGGGTGTMYMMSSNPEVMAFEGTALISLADSDNLTINGNLQGMVDNGGYSAQGISAFPKGSGSGSPVHLVVNGNIDFWGASDNPELDQPGAEAGWGIQAKKTNGAYDFYHGSRWAPAGVQLSMSGGSTADLNGDVRISVRGNGLVAAGTYAVAGMNDYDLAVINANKGDVTIYTPKSTERGYNALASYGGTINVNWENGAPGTHNVVLKGHITATKTWKPGTEGDDSGEPYYYRDGRVNVGLTTDKSSWSGLISNAGEKGAGEVNIALQNGAQWDHVAYSKADTLDAAHMPEPSNDHYGNYVPTSFVNTLKGGDSEEKAGVIFQNDGASIDIKDYSGHTKVIYKHDNAGTDAADYKGGDVKVGKAAAGSGMVLVTDNTGLNTASSEKAEKEKVEKALTVLAGKLHYGAHADGEENLAGKVEIAEGLTASSVALVAHEIDYKADGQGTLGAAIEIRKGGEETVMMRGAKTAMASSAALWRNTGSDLYRRMGDLRLAKEEQGIWAKYRGGKLSMDTAEADFDTKYHGVSVGYDKVVDHGWVVGGAIGYIKGDGTYREGDGDLKQTDFGVYGTKINDDGRYLDLVAKVGNLKNDFHVMNDMGNKLDGDYKANSFSLSAEYGKRFVQDNGFYIDPSVRFTVGCIGSKSFDAASDMKDGKGGFKSMHIEQDSFTSTVGRLGLSIGKQADNYNAFAKMVLAHEFSGAFDTTFSAEGEAQGSKTNMDLKDTWFELKVGGSVKTGDTTYLYGTFSRSMGSDVTSKWRADAGVRLIF